MGDAYFGQTPRAFAKQICVWLAFLGIAGLATNSFGAILLTCWIFLSLWIIDYLPNLMKDEVHKLAVYYYYFSTILGSTVAVLIVCGLFLSFSSLGTLCLVNTLLVYDGVAHKMVKPKKNNEAQ